MAFLERCGHSLLKHNYRTPWCEIDLISIDENSVLHAIEVKSWQGKVLRHPLEVFSQKRIKKNQRALLYFIENKEVPSNYRRRPPSKEAREKQSECKLEELSLSFDLLWVRGENYIEYYPGLF